MTTLNRFESSLSRGFMQHEAGALAYLTVPAIEACGAFIHGFTSRLGGVSDGPYATLNLSMTREPEPVHKRENYRRVAAALHVDPASLVLVNYEHGDGIAEIGAADAGKGFVRPTNLPKCDALVVTAPGVTAVTLHADCIPVFCVDVTGKRGAVCHAGWKGTALRLPQKLVQRLVTAGSRVRDLHVGIGPHIRECCFEVGADVADVFQQEFGEETVSRTRGEKAHVNLERAILIQLMQQGLRPHQITVSGDCTYCDHERFFSHRRDHGITGAMGSFLAIK